MRLAIAGGEVALVEDEEQHCQHAVEPLGEVRGVRPGKGPLPTRSSSSLE
jgi:hypothetical protein